MPNFLIALFLVAHGIVHPILAYHPSRDAAQVVGGLWKKSWLLGEGFFAKRVQWLLAFATLLLFVLAALSLLGWLVPQDWWRALWIAAASSSLLTLALFWFTEFFFGVLIDAALLALVLLANWTPLG